MNKLFGKNVLLWMALASFSLMGLNACAKKQTVKKTTDEQSIEQADADNLKSEELDIHGKDFMNSPDLANVYFDYDSSELSDEARKILSENAAYLKKNPGQEILTEGHCDERGTVGYNLALGQKRSASVRQYYIYLGIKPSRIGSLSYGKEKPVCFEADETCWNQNRRVETKVRTIKVSTNGKVDDSTDQ